jgi:hypothetical protein
VGRIKPEALRAVYWYGKTRCSIRAGCLHLEKNKISNQRIMKQCRIETIPSSSGRPNTSYVNERDHAVCRIKVRKVDQVSLAHFESAEMLYCKTPD